MNIPQAREFAALARPAIVPPLDLDLRPAALAFREFSTLVQESGGSVPVALGLERVGGTRSRFDTFVLPADHPQSHLNPPYLERMVKMLLWQRGGFRLRVGGPVELAKGLSRIYLPAGMRAFDWEFMGPIVSERPFEVVPTAFDAVPKSHESTRPLGGNLDGCRIGFDLGASDRKVAAVIDGNEVFSEEVVWDPRGNDDPEYHYREISASLKSAAAHLPRVDAIGGSSAGIIVTNRPMVASIFRGIPEKSYGAIREIFVRIARDWGVPFEIANDGEVTALAGAMALEDGCVLGVAMGSSEAAGYVAADRNITPWLDELAFAPVDVRPDAPRDEWSGDAGVGAQYLTQQAVFRLAKGAGIALDSKASLADQLKSVQKLLESGDERARAIWHTIGIYFGYAIAFYALFYEIRHILVLGRVTSGRGGKIIVEEAERVLAKEFPDLAGRIKLHLPDEKLRRVGQAVAAASLPRVEGR